MTSSAKAPEVRKPDACTKWVSHFRGRCVKAHDARRLISVLRIKRPTPATRCYFSVFQ
jgi:hypothetical protein